MTTAPAAIEVFTDEDGNYHVVGPCTREHALALMRDHAAYLEDSHGPNALAPEHLDCWWARNPVPGIPDGDVIYEPVPAGTPGAVPVTTSLY
ncbi:hypothetical protein ACWEGE_10295 [Amycolatopsis sp. NPDC004747]